MKYLFFFLFFTSCISSCKNENTIEPDYILGKWVIVEASRNNKKTNTLNGAFFYFDNKVLTTNFMGVENQATYLVSKNVLLLTKGLDYSFHLEKTKDNCLLMNSKIQKTDFTFKLKRE